jgi:hypothetical protein
VATIGYVAAMLLVKIEEEEVDGRVKFQDHLRGLQLQIGWQIVCLGEDFILVAGSSTEAARVSGVFLLSVVGRDGNGFWLASRSSIDDPVALYVEFLFFSVGISRFGSTCFGLRASSRGKEVTGPARKGNIMCRFH